MLKGFAWLFRLTVDYTYVLSKGKPKWCCLTDYSVVDVFQIRLTFSLNLLKLVVPILYYLRKFNARKNIYRTEYFCYYEKIGSDVKDITEEIPFDVPNTWQYIRLKELIKLISGVSYEKADICSNGIRILRGGNVGYLTVQLQEDDVFLPAKYFDEEKQVKIGDVIIVASTGSKVAIGRAGFVEKDYSNTQIGAFLRIIRPNNIEFADYIKCLLSTDYYREHIRNKVHGNTINNIKSEYIEDFIVPLPPMKEQARIALRVKDLMSILKDET